MVYALLQPVPGFVTPKDRLYGILAMVVFLVLTISAFNWWIDRR